MGIHVRLTAISLALAAAAYAGSGLSPLPLQLRNELKAQESARATRVVQGLDAAKFSLGLGLQDTLSPVASEMDDRGEIHVRLKQVYRGVEVYNGRVIGHMTAEGLLQAPNATVQPGIDLAPTPLLPEAKIRQLLLAQMHAGGRPWILQVKPIVFPTRYQDGLKTTRNAEGRLVIDPAYSVGTAQKGDPYRWAFQASATRIDVRGVESTEFILDACTGEVLRKWNGVQASAPAKGTGNSQYNGSTVLDTERLEDGTFRLRDLTRATRPHPFAAANGWTDLEGVVGVQTVRVDPASSTPSGLLPYTNGTNTWGDGHAFDALTDFPGNLATPRGETAAVDAHYAISATWDYYQNVLGRSGGIDGQGSSPISVVHMPDDNGKPMGNAYWSPALFLMAYGDGFESGAATVLDVAAHEMSHGVMTYTANLAYSDESGGLNEANSDIHGIMVKYYAWGAGGRGERVPDTVAHPADGSRDWKDLWTIGRQLSLDPDQALRVMYKPSLDGLSYDAWFDGIGMDDTHFTSGPGNRAFFFLARGASAKMGAPDYSPYLPDGMEGIGNQKAIRIWYRAMTRISDSHADYHAVREAMVAAARDLYPQIAGFDSPEVAAVKKAFRAVNVVPASEAGAPVRLIFPRNETSPFRFNQVQFVPATIPVTLVPPQVTNSANTSVTWSLGGIGTWGTGGHLEGNRFTAPLVAGGYGWPVKAASVADPRQFAVGVVFGVGLDIDGDTDIDTCDMGAMALSYGHKLFAYPAHNLLGGPGQDSDLLNAIYLSAFRSANSF